MKITKRAWGLTLLALAALVFMLWLADLLHFGKITPGTVALKAAPERAGNWWSRSRKCPRICRCWPR